ncbi:MAG: M56 family metallopeptidase, partial [Pedobacter sp.]
RMGKGVLIVLLGTGILFASAFKAAKPKLILPTKQAEHIVIKKQIASIVTDTTKKTQAIITKKQKKIHKLQDEIDKLTQPGIPEAPEVPANVNNNLNSNNNVHTPVTPQVAVPARVSIAAAVAVPAKIAISPKVSATTTTTRSITVNGDQVGENEFPESVMKNITDDLFAAGIIKQTKSMSYKIDPKELIVNGVKQSEELHDIFKKKKVCSAGNYWEEQLKALAIQFEISTPVQLLQSGITKVPLIVGHLRPVILIPLGMLNGLSGKEIEAILCHELAHIKRQDYLVNLLQSFAEILFFFNPAVLWISKLIREERENCCDDLALSITSNKKEYVHALISCEEFDVASVNYAMAFGKKRNQLMDRVSRIIFNKSTSLN